MKHILLSFTCIFVFLFTSCEKKEDTILTPSEPIEDIYYIKYVGSYSGSDIDTRRLSGFGPNGWENITLTGKEGEIAAGPVQSGFVAEGLMSVGNKNTYPKTTNLSIYISKNMGPYILVKTVSNTEKACSSVAHATYTIP